MKKLFIFGLFLLFGLPPLTAQKNSVYVFTGPSTVYYKLDDVEKSKGHSPIGYAIGLDLARNLNTQWQIKLGIRYCLWKTPNLIGPFQWPSEVNNGAYQYDPSLSHYLISDYAQQKAVQYLSGFRWQSKSQEFHWVADVEFGFSSFSKNQAGISTHLHPTAGLGFGAEMLVGTHMFLFARPGAQVIFRDIKSENIPVRQLLNFHVEVGGRYAF